MKLDEATTIPMWWMFVAVPTLVGGIVWLSFIAYSSEASASKLQKLEERFDKKEELLIQIREDVAVIKEKLTTKGN